MAKRKKRPSTSKASVASAAQSAAEKTTFATAGTLTARQQLFVNAYIIEPNATKAAIAAGYSPNGAAQAGARLLRNVQIRAALNNARVAQTARLQVSADDVLREWLRIARSDIGQILDFSGDVPRLKRPADIPEDARRAISSVKVKRYMEGAGDDAVEVEVTEFKLWDKLNALEKLARHLGLLKEQPGQTNIAADQVVIYIPDNSRQGASDASNPTAARTAEPVPAKPG